MLPPPAEPYYLVAEPDGMSWTARENLTEILRRELLGPIYGDEEVLPVDPSTAYPLGRIAPKDPEDFLHGAACHNCTMASETSCETANRFLDRRFLIGLPGEYTGLGFFEVSS